MSDNDYQDLEDHIISIKALEKELEAHRKKVSTILRKSNCEYALQGLKLIRIDTEGANIDVKAAILHIENQLKNLE